MISKEMRTRNRIKSLIEFSSSLHNEFEKLEIEVERSV